MRSASDQIWTEVLLPAYPGKNADALPRQLPRALDSNSRSARAATTSAPILIDQSTVRDDGRVIRCLGGVASGAAHHRLRRQQTADDELEPTTRETSPSAEPKPGERRHSTYPRRSQWARCARPGRALGLPCEPSGCAPIDVNFPRFGNRRHQARSPGGEPGCGRRCGGDLADIFDAGFPIRSMKPIEEFSGDDNASMAADNTSAYNCRARPGEANRGSR